MALLGSVEASAQSGPVFPPSVVITNYNRVLVGEQESLEAGAYVARVNDTTAGWYNPAGMALVDRTAIGASGSGFETDVLSLENINKAGGSFSISQLPSYFGVVLGADVLHSPIGGSGSPSPSPSLGLRVWRAGPRVRNDFRTPRASVSRRFNPRFRSALLRCGA